jgi:drug/metabolite transporter (DMT)-like permease
MARALYNKKHAHIIHMFLDLLPVLSAYGITPLLHKHILGHISPEGIIFTSTFFYFLLVIIFYFGGFREHINDDISIMNKKPYLYGLVALYGIIFLFICEYLYFRILRKHNTSVVTAIVASYPLFTLLFTYLFFQEKIEYAQIIGTIFVVIGIVILALSGETVR